MYHSIDESIEKEREFRPRFKSEKLLFFVHLFFVEDTKRQRDIVDSYVDK